MNAPCIITVAIAGSVPRKKDNPAVPISVAEQIESPHEAFEAGATLVHLHVRDEIRIRAPITRALRSFRKGFASTARA